MLVFPDRVTIKDWADLVSSLGLEDPLRQYLPPMNDNWSNTVETDFALTRLAPGNDDLSKSAARLFYRITKNHRFVDGNKRSAVVCTYLLFIANSCWLTIPPKMLYKTAKSIARGRKEQEMAIESLAELFAKYLIAIDTI